MFSIFVNSTDKFSDTWVPFFTLFSRHWPSCQHDIILNTEHLSFFFAPLKITSTLNGVAGISETDWGSSVLRALTFCHRDIVLYLQDDYFLDRPVNTLLLNTLSDIMIRNDVDCIRLCPLGRDYEVIGTLELPHLVSIGVHSDYRISLQASLWRKRTLCQYLRAGETAWEFERWGTIRSYQRKDILWSLAPRSYFEDGVRAVSYYPTGIVRGKWLAPAVVELFHRNNIEVDFSKRGFFLSSPRRRLLQKCRSSLRRCVFKVIAALSQAPSSALVRAAFGKKIQ